MDGIFSAGFRFEEEVRFVLRVNPAVTSRANGALLDIAATDIMSARKFDVSEELQRSEQGLIRLIGYDLLAQWSDASIFS